MADGVVSGFVANGGRAVALADVRGIYVGQLEESALPQPDPSSSTGAPGGFALLRLLATWMNCPVLDRPENCAHDRSKPTQLRLLRECGFEVPRTLVTNSPEEARRFHQKCSGRVIFKPMSDRRAVVSRLDADAMQNFSRLECCPTMFQEWHDGVDVRVHVVGEDVFATEIHSTATDYRHPGAADARASMQATAIPGDVARRCVELTRRLGLVVSGIDLRRRDDGRWTCFEANPAPGFAYYQLRTNQPIAEAIADLLWTSDPRWADRRLLCLTA